MHLAKVNPRQRGDEDLGEDELRGDQQHQRRHQLLRVEDARLPSLERREGKGVRGRGCGWDVEAGQQGEGEVLPMVAG